MLFMRILLLWLALLLLSGCHNDLQAGVRQQTALQRQATSIVQQFTATLKPQLKQALQKSGPAGAIRICSKVAPALARQLSHQTGWTIKRVSLKARNHHTARPDTWEKSVLQQFDREQVAGKSPAGMIVTHIEHGTFRFMKAQAVTPVCLVCHGTGLHPDVIAALKKFYPNDQATGYLPGQIRGAFSLSKRI